MEYVYCIPTLHMFRMFNVFGGHKNHFIASIAIINADLSVELGKKVNIFIDICLVLRNECESSHFLFQKRSNKKLFFFDAHECGARHAS